MKIFSRVNFDHGEGGGGGDQGGDGSGDLGWRSALPDELKNHDLVKDYSKPGDAIQAFVDLHGKSASMVSIPGDNATDEDKAAFFNKLGRPESADAYTLDKPEGLREGLYNEDVETAYRAKAHEIGLPDSQANQLYAWYYDTVKSGDEQQVAKEKQTLDDTVTKLKNEWPGDAFKVNTELAHRAFKVFAGGEDDSAAKDFLEKTIVNGVALGNHPMFLKGFVNFAKLVADDTLEPGSQGRSGEKSDEQKAKERFPNTEFKE